MSEDYACPGRRKSKGDKRAKGRFAKYKRGGAQRATNILVSNQPKQN
jgi:hypothetical protein